MEKVTEVSCGSRHMGVISKGIIYMCGSGEAGQLGTGKRQREIELIPIETQNAIQISCGEFHTGFITNEHNVYMMGGNSFGQLGIGNKKSMAIPVEVNILNALKIACGNHTVCITTEGLFVWGNSVFGEFLSPKKIKISRNSIVDIAIGGSFGIAIDSKSKIFAWGSNSNGELATGDYSTKTSAVEIKSLAGKKLKKIAAGSSFCICLGEDPKKYENSKRESLIDVLSVQLSSREFKPENPLSDPNSLLQEEKKKNSKLNEEIDELHRINVELKESLQSKLQESNIQYQQISSEAFTLKDSLNEVQQQMLIIKSENIYLKEEALKLKKIIDSNNQNAKIEVAMNKLKEKHYLELQDLQAQIDKEKVLRKQVERDLEVACSHRHRLEKALASSHNHLEDQHLEKEKLLIQNIEELMSEKTKITQDLEKALHQLIDYQQDIQIMHEENKFYSDNTKQLHFQQEKLQQHIQELKNSMENLNKIISQQDLTLRTLSDENYTLKNTIGALELKISQQMLDKEKEFSDKTKEFKEKAMNILNPKVPSLKNVMPQTDILKEDLSNSNRRNLALVQREKMKNAVTKIVENQEIDSPLKSIRISSPSRVSPGDNSFRPEGFTFRKAVTPSKDDVKSKIAALMQNRSRIEKKLQLLQNEQENL